MDVHLSEVHIIWPWFNHRLCGSIVIVLISRAKESRIDRRYCQPKDFKMVFHLPLMLPSVKFCDCRAWSHKLIYTFSWNMNCTIMCRLYRDMWHKCWFILCVMCEYRMYYHSVLSTIVIFRLNFDWLVIPTTGNQQARFSRVLFY